MVHLRPVRRASKPGRSGTSLTSNRGCRSERLSVSEVESACRDWNHRWRNRIHTPWITLSMFLSQILSSDHSCGDALKRFQKYRKSSPGGLHRVRVDLGGRPPRPPTDPDVRVKRIWLFIS